jgi:hypothetical protein
VAVSDRARVVEIVSAYNTKYAWNLDADALPGPFYEVRADVVFGWVSDNSGVDGGAAFQGTVTKWRPGPAST